MKCEYECYNNYEQQTFIRFCVLQIHWVGRNGPSNLKRSGKEMRAILPYYYNPKTNSHCYITLSRSFVDTVVSVIIKLQVIFVGENEMSGVWQPRIAFARNICLLSFSQHLEMALLSIKLYCQTFAQL